ncbi:hypothetical protein LX15_004528 [Streptoalloteichus tenebrarius]|uniref:Uncharacterized protein n=1 Tax=Streptoalloteichus tenebrarius (strain ATCC 17920 / DSM 40477 / JCM 4838 / CBS 697.72 / NBRC 16177 / NCIMB 11028 / NRRL B-12390 / A12253. 1 / ISP 5477) TaxID=1933 RepID=A0ABT1HZ55_STRSD|nr:hypothetical protein [Streptoalloteichus tenebrarius]
MRRREVALPRAASRGSATGWWSMRTRQKRKTGPVVALSTQSFGKVSW